jgi:hypothetical protein
MVDAAFVIMPADRSTSTRCYVPGTASRIHPTYLSGLLDTRDTPTSYGTAGQRGPRLITRLTPLWWPTLASVLVYGARKGSVRELDGGLGRVGIMQAGRMTSTRCQYHESIALHTCYLVGSSTREIPQPIGTAA